MIILQSDAESSWRLDASRHVFVGSTSWTWTRVEVSSGDSGADFAAVRRDQTTSKRGRSIEALLSLIGLPVGRKFNA
jgi:hypothetical protein